MPNLLLTQKCVRKCPYCFAEQYMAETSSGFLEWGDYIYVVDFLERNKVPVVSMLGGEPTVHPHVVEMMDYALLRGLGVRVFTSGVMSEARRGALQALWTRHEREGRKVHFIVNVNEPAGTPEAERRSQEAFLELAGPRASISFNIYRPDFDLGFAFEYIARYELTPTIRLGLAHPIARARESNAHLAPDGYRAVAANLERFFPSFERNGVTPGFDCGFPACMFTEAQLGRLLLLKATFNWMCGPVIDIGPDLELWPCFPLSHIRGKTLYDFDDLQQAHAYFVDEVRTRRRGNTGIFLECDDCDLRARQMCSGGCLTYALPESSLAQGDDPRRPAPRPAR